jgi:hypothetical protein
MAITHEQAAKQAATDAVTALVDAAADPGYVTICEDDSVLAVLTFNDPSFGAANASGTATLSVSPAISVVAVGTGTANNFKVYDGADTLIFSGVASAIGGGGDMTLDNTSINTGQTISLASFTYNAGQL